MKKVLILFAVIPILGCASASEGKKRDWHGGSVKTSSCAASCAEWDSSGEVCLTFHEWTSNRCARILSKELR